jgi:hypothetical protein
VIFCSFCNCFHLIYKKEVKIVGSNSLFVWAGGVGRAGAARTCVLGVLYVCLLSFFDSKDWEYVSYNKYIKSIMVRALIVLGFLLICSSFNYVHDLQANLETILS